MIRDAGLAGKYVDVWKGHAGHSECMLGGRRGGQFMSDIRFECPACKQSLEAPADMGGELIDCPSCNNTLEVPISKSKPNGAVTQPIRSDQEQYSIRSSRRKEWSELLWQERKFPPVLFSVLQVLLSASAVIVGISYGYRLFENYKKAKSEEPFIQVAKDAIDEAHKMESAINVGLNFQKYGDQLIVLSAKVDNLIRLKQDTGVQSLRAKEFCDRFLETRDAYKCALRDWEFKITHTTEDDDRARDLEKMQEDWRIASENIDYLDWEYSGFLGKHEKAGPHLGSQEKKFH